MNIYLGKELEKKLEEEKKKTDRSYSYIIRTILTRVFLKGDKK